NGARHARKSPAARTRRSNDLFCSAFVLGPHLARRVHLRSGDVTVHVDAARHDYQAGGVDRFVRADVRIRRWVDNLAVTDPDIAALPVYAVDGVVDVSPGNLQEPAVHRVDRKGSLRAASAPAHPPRGAAGR